MERQHRSEFLALHSPQPGDGSMRVHLGPVKSAPAVAIRACARFIVLSAALTACGNTQSPTDVEFGWTHRAAVEGQVLTRSDTPLAGAIVVLRVKPSRPGATYPMSDTETDSDGHFELTVVRVPTENVRVGTVDTVTAYVVAGGGAELPDGRLPTDSTEVILHFVSRLLPPPGPTTVTVHVPVS